uniref:Uncharacterized protein n=1 Tax=Rhizophora mucronata TaxID=61149 RepID=A0A2P2IHJ2_RHIMU
MNYHKYFHLHDLNIPCRVHHSNTPSFLYPILTKPCILHKIIHSHQFVFLFSWVFMPVWPPLEILCRNKSFSANSMKFNEGKAFV